MARHVRRFSVVLSALIALSAASVFAFDGEDYEEDAGQCFSIHMHPGDDIYSFNAEDGTWLLNTPVFGQLFISLLSSRPEDAVYGGVGMMFRLMPHTDYAPFIGIGGSGYYPFSGDDNTGGFWGTHAEAGIRAWIRERQNFVELLGRHTWRSEKAGDEADKYWQLGLGFGQMF